MIHIKMQSVVLECSCGKFKRTATGGSTSACEERLNHEYQKHLKEHL